jgi:hypothetical protein
MISSNERLAKYEIDRIKGLLGIGEVEIEKRIKETRRNLR